MKTILTFWKPCWGGSFKIIPAAMLSKYFSVGFPAMAGNDTNLQNQKKLENIL
jgi:hypothetical protein